MKLHNKAEVSGDSLDPEICDFFSNSILHKPGAPSMGFSIQQIKHDRQDTVKVKTIPFLMQFAVEIPMPVLMIG